MTQEYTTPQHDPHENAGMQHTEAAHETPTPNKGWRNCRRWLSVVWWCLVVLSCVCLIVSAYGGCVNPEITTIGALMAMALPAFIIGVIIVGIISLWITRWGAATCALTLIACGGPILDYAPINFPRKMPDEQVLRDSSFTFMTYNVYNFWLYGGASPTDTVNPTISYILKEDPDVACLIECLKLEPHFYAHVTQAQLDSLTSRYPYYHLGPEGCSLFSKFPITPIEVETTNSFSNQVSAFRATIHGRQVTIIATHLISIGLGSDDRALYGKLSYLGAVERMGSMRQQLYDKLNRAFRKRAEQARELRQLIDRIGGKNVIVAGDFNDIQGCYALRTVMGDDFHSVYSERGLGPDITYYGEKFYFRIDHILYRGCLDPLWVRIDHAKSSDHYPMLTQFLFTDHS